MVTVKAYESSMSDKRRRKSELAVFSGLREASFPVTEATRAQRETSGDGLQNKSLTTN